MTTMKGGNIERYLREWAKNYIMFKDAFNKRIKRIDEKKCLLEIVNKDGSIDYAFIKPFVDSIIKTIRSVEDEKINVFVFNSRPNLDKVIEEWDALKGIKGLALVFVNPFSVTETKWVLSPYLHSMMTERSALESGLKSMFSMVEEIDEDELKERVR